MYYVLSTTYKTMNIIFFGSDDFASVHLEALFKSPHKVLACVTPPDKPQGRGMKLTAGPVKEIALKNKVPVLQPEDIKDKGFQQKIKDLKADLFVVIAYGKFLPQQLLDVPKIFSINVHGSLLPKYRGAAPINWALIKGEKETGISIIKMNEKMDAGDIVAQMEIDIDDEDTALSLREKMKRIGPAFLIETIDNVGAVRERPLRPQDPKKVTFAPKLTKEMGKIDWRKSAVEIYNLVRALQPWPSAYTMYKGKQLKVLISHALQGKVPLAAPGEIVEVSKSEIVVATGEGVLALWAVHLADSKPMDVKDFLLGYRIEKGHIFQG